MSTAINQHYIPQFLLRNFQIPEKKGSEKAIFVFDKSTTNEYQSPIKQAATERYFYEVRTEGSEYSIENELGKYESLTSPIIQKIIENKSLKSITRKEKMIVTRFICLQLLRVPVTRNRFSDLAELFEREFDIFKSNGISKPTADEDKIAHCDFVLSSVTSFAPFIYNKDWLLCESHDANYMIGDNPVVMNNTFNESHRGLGLKSEGIEIYMPISPKYCLLLICSSVRKNISKILAEPSNWKKDELAAERLNQFSKFLKRNETVISSNDNVIFANSLQIAYSERFIYSHKKQFDLPKEIVATHGNSKPALKFY